MRISIDLTVVFILRKNNIINLILESRFLDSYISYELLCFWLFEQFWMNNSIAFNTFYWHEQNELIFFVKRSHRITVLIQENRCLCGKFFSVLCF